MVRIWVGHGSGEYLVPVAWVGAFLHVANGEHLDNNAFMQ